jgi:hypothetical protein
MSNQEVLASIADPAYQTELGAYNIEFNVPPRPLAGRAALELEDDVRASLNAAESKANTDGAHIVMVGILPTLMPEHLSGDWMSESTATRRSTTPSSYARGEDILIDITGPERLSLQWASIAPEIRLHQHAIAPPGVTRDFARNWNAAQGLAARSWRSAPTRRSSSGTSLWAETRIECSPRPPIPARRAQAQGVRPRGLVRRAVDHVDFDLFEENVRLLPVAAARVVDEDPCRIGRRTHAEAPRATVAQRHDLPWNRPVYDVVDRRPHLRVENRVLPAGPPSST